MPGESVQFDPTGSRASYSDQPVPPGGTTRALRQVAESSGLDAVAELYNEALHLATEGHFAKARERLDVLLALAPEDGEARLLQAKVLVAQQRWQEALDALDEAEAAGRSVPDRLRDAVEEHLEADQASQSEQRAARAAREQGEIKALRQEARRLRSENAQLVGRNRELEQEMRKWAWTTAAVSGVAIVFVLGNLLFGGSAPTADEVAAAMNRQTQAPTPAATAPADDPAAAPTAPAAATPIEELDTPSTATRAAEVLRTLPGLEGSRLELEVQGDEAVLGGSVERYRQLKDAEKALYGVDGIEAVATDDVTVLARTEGATHTVVSGDNLSKIAYEYYGESSRAKDILRANNAVLHGRPDLQIDMVLDVPPIE